MDNPLTLGLILTTVAILSNLAYMKIQDSEIRDLKNKVEHLIKLRVQDKAEIKFLENKIDKMGGNKNE